MPIEVRSELGANVWKVLVTPGQSVKADDVLLILESMKMEVTVLAPEAGTIIAVLVAEGDAIDEDAALVTIETGA